MEEISIIKVYYLHVQVREANQRDPTKISAEASPDNHIYNMTHHTLSSVLQ